MPLLARAGGRGFQGPPGLGWHGFHLSWHHKGNGQGHSEHLIFAFSCVFLLSIGNGFRIMPCTECVLVCLRNKLHRNPPSPPHSTNTSHAQAACRAGHSLGFRWASGDAWGSLAQRPCERKGLSEMGFLTPSLSSPQSQATTHSHSGLYSLRRNSVSF